MQGLPCLSSWKFRKALDVCFLLKSGTYWLKLSLLEKEVVVLTFEYENFFVLSVLVESIFSVVLLESSSDEFQSIAWDCDSLKYYVLWYIEIIAFSSNHLTRQSLLFKIAHYLKGVVFDDTSDIWSLSCREFLSEHFWSSTVWDRSASKSHILMTLKIYLASRSLVVGKFR